MKHDISKQLPKDIQPYERCMEQGAGALNNAELLAVILRTGSVGENSLELASRLLAILHGNDAYGISKRERYRRYRATTLCIILLCNNLIQLGDT